MTAERTDQHAITIGIMQGRLSEPVPGVIQAFPVATWQQEFSLAARAGLACIEWVYQSESEASNPLATDSGAGQVRRTIEKCGVPVYAVSADIYMKQRLITHGGEIHHRNVEHLIGLLRRSRKIGAHHVMAAFVDGGRLATDRERASLVRMLHSILPILTSLGIEFHFEADWPADTWAGVMQDVNSPLVRICYDIGDRAALGCDAQEDLAILGPWLGSVHVKDRLLGGGTVPLGTGRADFPCALRCIRDLGYAAPLILQAAPEHGVDPYDLAIRNKTMIAGWMGRR